MANEEKSNIEETNLNPPSPPKPLTSLLPPNFPNSQKPFSGTNIEFEESASNSEVAPSEAPIFDAQDSSSIAQGSAKRSIRGLIQESARGSTLKRSSIGDEPKSRRRKTSNSMSISKVRESTATNGKLLQKQWNSRHASLGLDGFNLDNPEVKELLRRLKEAEESTSSSNGHAKLSSPKPREYHRGFKALHRAVQENEIPMRMAYEHLDELAANAERVKFAIETNRSLLILQVKKINERILRVAFMAWSLEVGYQKHKRRQMRKALAWSIKSLVSHVFKGLRQMKNIGKKRRRFETSVRNILQRRKLSQAWIVWREMIAEIHCKHQEMKKEKKLRKNIDKNFREDIAKRAITIMRRSQLCCYFRFFQRGVEARMQARAFLKQMLILLLKKCVFRAFIALRDAAQKRVHDRVFIKARVRMMVLRKCFKGWWKSLIKNQYLHRSGLENNLLHSMFHKWYTWIKYKMHKRKKLSCNIKKLSQKMVYRMFRAYSNVIKERNCLRGLVMRQLRKSSRRLLKQCFQAWISFMQMGVQKKMDNVQRFASAAEKENEKLRLHNERLSTIIDNGDQNKDRISDLLAAQQVLSAERIALTELIGHLQQQNQQALDQQEQQDHEIKHLKDRLLSENNYFERNKLLIKGASSFNTLMRVMKHDMLKTKARTPKVVYEVNNMAMDQVFVFPDGELHVKALKPQKKGTWSNTITNRSTTRTPLLLSNKLSQTLFTHLSSSPLKLRSPSPPLSYNKYSFT